MSRVTITDNFEAEVTHALQLDEELEQAIWNDVRDVSVKAKEGVKRKMPVDTGAARARWGTPEQPGGVWNEDRDNLTIEHGAALDPFEYISRLNEGYSTQAPAGFIDVEVEKAADDLTDGILQVVVREWSD